MFNFIKVLDLSWWLIVPSPCFTRSLEPHNYVKVATCGTKIHSTKQLCGALVHTNSAKRLVQKNQVNELRSVVLLKILGHQIPLTTTSALMCFAQAKWSNWNVAKQVLTNDTTYSMVFTRPQNRMGSIVHIQQKYQRKQGDGWQRRPLVSQMRLCKNEKLSGVK